jgi:tRNA (guanine-N7-)-methyltransferase
VDPARYQFIPPDYFRKLAKSELVEDPSRPFEIDLGCGDGSFLTALAAHHPERDYLGVERLLGRVRKVCKKIGRAGLENAKVLRLETSYTLEWLLPDECASRVHLLFPDPWPKKKHHKRRMVTAEFCAALRRVLQADGEFLFKTDHGEYFDGAMEVLDECPFLKSAEWGEDEFYYPQTDFECLWRGQGKPIYSARFLLDC